LGITLLLQEVPGVEAQDNDQQQKRSRTVVFVYRKQPGHGADSDLTTQERGIYLSLLHGLPHEEDVDALRT
jgi:hypothetical protein